MVEIWNDYTDQEDREEIKKTLEAFNRVINDLLMLNDQEYICNILQSSSAIKEKYRKFIRTYGDLAELSMEFEIMRNILFGSNLDWEEISKTL
ncbi:hypothetical protein [Peptoniphilus timonensis]|uniref:hypothetical protein n=1 Tax=Peptoniphilus timonensis TaxID=1268254 RepID=UPI0002D4A3D2|nr:hypothetical protein [Peptoniphilus timonensis]